MLLGCMSVLAPSQVLGQVLNQRINQLLANNCLGLGTGGFPTPNLTGLGAQLANLCDVPQTAGSVSSGGGAASFQGATSTFLARSVQRRLDELQQKAAQATSSKFLPDAEARSVWTPLGGLGRLIAHSNRYSLDAPNQTVVFAAQSEVHPSGLGFFVTGSAESLDRKVTTFEDGYSANTYGLSFGVDYSIERRLIVGASGSYANTKGDFVAGGDFSTSALGGIVYLSTQPTDETFVQASLGYNRLDYSAARLATALVTSLSVGNDRNVRGLATSDSVGNLFDLALMAGYDYYLNGITVGPRAGFNYTKTEINGYSESGSTGIELRYDKQSIESLKSRLGIFGSTVKNASFGVISFQGNLDYVHEFKNSQRFINVQFAQDLRANPTRFTFQNEVPDRDYLDLGLGVVMVLPNGWQPFFNFRTMLGNSQFTQYKGEVGARLEF